MSDSSEGEIRGWWYVVAVLEFPNNARRSFSLVCSGVDVMEYARRRLVRGDRGAADGIGE